MAKKANPFAKKAAKKGAPPPMAPAAPPMFGGGGAGAMPFNKGGKVKGKSRGK
jgi:hypothetical protein